MTNPEAFYKELEDFARESKNKPVEGEYIPSGARHFITLMLTVFLVGISYVMYIEGRELYDYRRCEQTTSAVVLSCHYDHKSCDDLVLLYTPEGSAEQVFVQHVREAEDYPVGTAVRVRYRDGQAFIDNWKESKYNNLITMGIILVFWCFVACILGCVFYEIFIRTPSVCLRRWLRHRA